MKMRFTDIHKWNKRWFRDLSPDAKLLLLYLYDACGDAGVIEVDPRKYSFDTGLDLNKETNALDELLETGKIEFLDNRFYILPNFIKFQYPNGIKTNYNPHKSVLREAEKHNLDINKLVFVSSDSSLDQGLSNPFKVKVKDKDKVKFKDRVKIKALFHKLTQNAISPRLNLEESRIAQLNRIISKHGIIKLARTWRKAGKSKFLTNANNANRNGWVANFDWLHKPQNFLKVMEGNYDNNNGEEMNYENGF